MGSRMSDFTFKCPECPSVITVDAGARGLQMKCTACGRNITIPAHTPSKHGGSSEEIVSRVSDSISEVVGVEKLEGFSLRNMFSDVFSRHSFEEVERYFSVGGPDTTPSIAQVDTSWPKPWLFFRSLIVAVVAYLGLVQAWKEFENLNLIPGLIMVGSFAVPFATLLFFFEANVRRNVSLYQTNRLILVGGVLSLIVSLMMFELAEKIHISWLGASVAGLVEEPAKLCALAIIINNARYPYILNGMLFGAAVGTGFAAFESAGYALRFALARGTGAMNDVIVIRGLLAPFSHIAWTAMAAAALWRIKGPQRFEFAMVRNIRFLKVAGAAVVLHMVWNMDFTHPFYLKNFALGAVAWVILFGLIQEGLKQLRAEKNLSVNADTVAAPKPSAP